MEIIDLPISGVALLKPKTFTDHRGEFCELFNYYEAGVFYRPPTQISRSRSVMGVFRGMHFQHTRWMDKVMQVIRGGAYVYVTDLRKQHNTFLKTVTIWLDEKENKQLFVPNYCAVGFYAVEDNTEMLYLHSHTHENEYAVSIDYKSLNIKLPVSLPPILSDRDKNAINVDELTKQIWFTQIK